MAFTQIEIAAQILAAFPNAQVLLASQGPRPFVALDCYLQPDGPDEAPPSLRICVPKDTGKSMTGVAARADLDELIAALTGKQRLSGWTSADVPGVSEPFVGLRGPEDYRHRRVNC